MRIALISKSPYLERRFEKTAHELFRMTGNNTGNLAFTWAINQHISGYKQWFDWDFDPSVINDNFDLAVLVCANMINNEIDLTILNDRIERLAIPMTALSIGTQSNLRERLDVLNPTIERFIALTGTRCRSIGLRGENAASIFSSRGFSNYRIIGCPSNFISYDKSLGQKISHAIDSRDGNIAYHMEMIRISTNSQILAHLRDIAPTRRINYFIQSPIDWVALGRTPINTELTSDQKAMIDRWFPARTEVDYRAFVDDHINVFFDLESWLEAMMEYGLSVGPRLHGNIIALQAGVPCLILAHDGRISELASSMSYPMLTPEDFCSISSYSELQNFLIDQLSNFDVVRMSLAAEYKNLLAENSVPITKEFNDF